MSSVAATLRAWLPLAFATSVLAFGGLLAWHQQLRRAADEPQRALARDAAAAIAAGRGVAALLPPPIALESSDGLFLAGYDRHGIPLWSSARLRGTLPAPPAGVFAFAEAGEHRLTWMPMAGVREALVIVPAAAGGYVLAGRSLRETEARKSQVLRIALGAWAVALAGSFALAFLARPRS